MNLNTQRYFQTGRVPNVGITAVQLYQSGSLQLRAGVWIKADSGNTANLFVGKENVTAWTNPATDGFPLQAGQSHLFTVDQLSGIFLRANLGSGNAWWYAA